MKIRIDFEDKNIVFQNPIKIFQTSDINLFMNYFNDIEDFIRKGYYAAGFLSYEASEGFNKFNKTKNYKKNKLPLLLFGVFESYTTFEERRQYAPSNLNLISDTQPEQYKKTIDYIKQQIELGNTYQVNYTINFKGSFEGNPEFLYDFLSENNCAKYCSYIELDEYSIISVSPELFFKINNNAIITKPMKGTAARGLNLEGDIVKLKELFSDKNKAENMMIVDLLRNDLTKISKPGSVSVAQLFEAEKYPTVWQLTSTIMSELKKDISLYKIFESLFPSGSITGAPKTKTMEIISNIENENREVYCGTIGYVEPQMKNAIFNIPIRTLIVDNKSNSIKYGVGGGITWDSTAKGEFDEVLEKTAILNCGKLLPDYLIEAILFSEGNFLFLEEHLNRLGKTAKYFDYKINIDNIRNALTTYSNRLQRNLSYKINIKVDSSGQTDVSSTNICNNFLINNINFGSIVNTNNVFLYHKTSNREHLPKPIPQMEHLIQNEKGNFTEFISGNVAMLIDGVWLTPNLESGLLPGIMREHYIGTGYLIEKPLGPEDLLVADKIAFLNSVRGWVDIDESVLNNLKNSLRRR